MVVPHDYYSKGPIPMPDDPNSVKTKTSRSYENLIESLRTQVTSGQWPVGAMLPSRSALSREYGVSLTTVQQAVAQLVGEGILRADGGRGTFVLRGVETPVRERDEIFADFPETPPTLVTAFQGRPLAGKTLGIVDCVSLRAGVLHADPQQGWLDTIASRLENAFSNIGGLSRLFQPVHAGRPIPISQAIRSLLAEGVDALAIVGVYEEPEILPELQSVIDWEETPCVYISWHEAPYFPHIYYDNSLAGYQAALHLKRRGYGPIAFLGPMNTLWSEQRLAGARAAAGEIDPILMLEYARWGEQEKWLEPIRAWFDDLMRRRPAGSSSQPCGVIAANDYTALLLMDYALYRGFQVGRDFGLIGFDNALRSRSVGLTTLRPPLEAFGEQAAAMLFRQLQGDKSGIQVRLQSQLLPRASTHRQSTL